MEIRECVPPPGCSRLTSHLAPGGTPTCHLAEEDGVTTLTFTQRDIDPVEAESVGPGWEYYLDRLVAAESGRRRRRHRLRP